jgi:hypothetical protein
MGMLKPTSMVEVEFNVTLLTLLYIMVEIDIYSGVIMDVDEAVSKVCNSQF